MVIKVGIFGATGSVGQEIIQVLRDREFPAASPRLFASERSAGKELGTPFGNIMVENANTTDFTDLDLAFFAVGGGWSGERALDALEAGCHIIDNSSTFRYGEHPLIVPEINPDTIGDARLIANPNCTTIIASIPLWKLEREYGLNRVLISTYQAASGAGKGGMEELEEGSRKYLEGEKTASNVFRHPLAFNVIPHIDHLRSNGYTNEEMKVVRELRKIFGRSDLSISCTCVRVPTFRAHAESVVVETRSRVDPNDVVELFRGTRGITVRDDVGKGVYPMPITASGRYDVEVGRIRRNLVFGDRGLEFFLCGDQLLKGAALNAVQIAEVLLERGVFEGAFDGASRGVLDDRRR